MKETLIYENLFIALCLIISLLTVFVVFYTFYYCKHKKWFNTLDEDSIWNIVGCWVGLSISWGVIVLIYYVMKGY